MDDPIARQLVEINTIFYENFAEPFSESRSAPQPGYRKLLEFLPKQPIALLDVGCGNGRFGQFLSAEGLIETYTGVDFSRSLLFEASGTFTDLIVRDLSLPGCLDGLGVFDVIVSLATLQHIPGEVNRARLLGEMSAHLKADGQIVITNWQFMESPRQRRKIRPWSEAGIEPTHLDPDDYLISWTRGGHGLRYVAYIDEHHTRRLAHVAGLRVVNQFRSDGREGDLNLYTILAG